MAGDKSNRRQRPSYGHGERFRLHRQYPLRATPVLVNTPRLSIELQDLQIDKPDISIDLPWPLSGAFGLLVDYFAGPVFGVIAGFLFSSLISSLAEAFIPSDLGSYVPLPGPQPVKSLPAGVDILDLSVVPSYLEMLGDWVVFVSDPRPLWSIVRIDDTVAVKRSGLPTTGTAWFACLGVLGVVRDATPDWGTPFEYLHVFWQSTVTATLDSASVPLPLTRSPWTIAIGYRSRETGDHPLVITVPAQTLVSGPLPVTSDVWKPEPPLKGKVVNQTFTIEVAL